MRVTRNTSEQLIIANKPWLIGILLILFILLFVGPGLLLVSEGIWLGWGFALAGGGTGAWAFVVFVRRVQLILDRPSDTITIRCRSLMGYTEVTHILSNLTGAELESTTGSKGRTLYRPTLILNKGMSAGSHPIVQSYTNTGGPKRVVNAVNDWLSNTRPNTRLDSGGPNA